MLDLFSDLPYEERVRYLWHILRRSAQDNVKIDSDAFHSTLGECKQELDEISKICKENGVKNLVSVMEYLDNINVPEEFEISKVGKFYPISENDIKFNFLLSGYCIFSIFSDFNNPDSDKTYLHNISKDFILKNMSALRFWDSLNWDKLDEKIDIDEFNMIVRQVIKWSFIPNDQKIETIENRKDALTHFCDFSAQHPFLVIHHKDWSEALDGLNKIRNRYEQEQKNIDDLYQEAKEKIRENEDKAERRTTENLLAPFAEKFERDADDYRDSASQWLRGTILSFLVIIVTTFYLLGRLKIETRPPNAGMVETLVDGIMAIGVLEILIVAMVLTYWGMKRLPVDWFGMLGVKMQPLTGFWRSITEASQIALWFILFMVTVYLFASYFSLSVETSEISAQSFLIPEKSQINWASLLSAVAPRILFLGLASAVTLFCMRMYRIQKHLEATNRYRVAALGSFSAFVDITRMESDEAKKREEELFNQLARLIYEPIQTGFMNDQKLKATDLANLVAAATKKSE